MNAEKIYERFVSGAHKYPYPNYMEAMSQCHVDELRDAVYVKTVIPESQDDILKEKREFIDKLSKLRERGAVLSRENYTLDDDLKEIKTEHTLIINIINHMAALCFFLCGVRELRNASLEDKEWLLLKLESMMADMNIHEEHLLVIQELVSNSSSKALDVVS